MKLPEEIPILVGEYEDNNAKSGITAVFPEMENVTGISQKGGAPATMGTEVLHPMHRKMPSVDAIVFAGRSIFGFIPALAIAKELKKDGKGIKIRDKNIPIVPAAAIFDFIDNDILPDESWGVIAYEKRKNQISIGRYGAGRGATVGKIMGIEYSMESGQGFSFLEKNGIYVASISVVNAFGDIYDENGNIIAGAKRNGNFIKTIKYMENFIKNGMNTTLGLIITNAKMDREDACSISEAANISLASIIKPFNTSFDGDTIFTISFKEREADIEIVKILAQEAIRKSVLSIFDSQ